MAAGNEANPRSRSTAVREGTSVDDMVTRLSQEIVAGDWPPGTRLTAAGIAQRFAVSRTPVREAFGHLFAMGLVERRPNRGVVTASIDEQELFAMFEAMAELEAACARFCALRMPLAERRALQALHESARAWLDESHRAQYSAFNDRFHSALYEGSRSDHLIELTRATRARLQPFRHTQFAIERRTLHSFDEHAAIVAAVVAGDAAAAAEAARAHVLSVARSARCYVEARSESAP
ncbi:GntR family transcriptional regulator [Salinisphaera sp.]|uniref:GntR family transcriptional regulator n=1 Tax=Salinisphaera sp. TaxID=1914330 RepID=UPI000C649C8A|nr:GntR family transcriptional regulator [Salinisphaera sp.]MBS62982.1 GntR family transcriptional regulator [Salinisphaera sp.]